MGLRDDLERFRVVGEERREDLTDFIQYGDLTGSKQNSVQVPIKVVDLPEFEYDQLDMGGIGQGDGGTPEPGDQVGQPQDGDGDGGEPGEEGAEHEYYEMDPEEFAEELDEELGLDLEPKGKTVVEETDGDFTDISRAGPKGTLDYEHLFKQGLKRKLAMDFDEEYVEEALKVEGWGPDEVFEWARGKSLPVSKAWIAARLDDIDAADLDTWASIEEMEADVEMTPTVMRVRQDGLGKIPFRREDERYRHQEVVERKERNVVVVNIRDVSGSMRESKRELVERTFTPLDWYLTGKYDRAEFIYIAHDADAWEVERDEFFGIRSGGGTKISSAYELAAELLQDYPFSEWNRFVFAAGDGENSHDDTQENVIPLMRKIDANLHAYLETRPSNGVRTGTHAEELRDALGDEDDVVVSTVTGKEDVMDAIYAVLSTQQDDA